jgi:hypothetical protein
MLGGNVRQFRAGLLNCLLDTTREYGPLASFRIGPRLSPEPICVAKRVAPRLRPSRETVRQSSDRYTLDVARGGIDGVDDFVEAS